MVGDYLDSVREIERRVQMAEKQHSTELVIPDAPIGTPNDITEYFKLMFDLMALAFQADITRVITVLHGSRSQHAHVHQPEHFRGVPSAVPSRQQPARRWTSW